MSERSSLRYCVTKTAHFTWLALGLSLAFAGCTRVHQSPEPSVDPIVADVVAVPGQTEAQGASASEPDGPESADPPLEPGELNAAQEDMAGPNEPAASEIAEQAAVTSRTVEPNEIRVQGPPAEPNQASTVGPTVEPNEAATAESRKEQPQVTEEPPDPIISFYEEYGQLLNQYVREDGRVDYDSLRRKRLWIKQLLRTPDELDPNLYRTWSESEQLAFWINTYNLKMLDVIARNYPIESSWWLRLTWPPSDIRHIEGIWSDYRFIVMDEEFTLGDLERRFFHQRFADPRSFLALHYATRSGPRFRRQPYRGDELDRQLDEQVRTFLSTDQGFRIDRDRGVVYLSALFKPTWRGKEFVARYGTDKKFKDRPTETRAVLNFLTHYVADDDVYFLEVENYTIEYTNFDWRLNDASRRP